MKTITVSRGLIEITRYMVTPVAKHQTLTKHKPKVKLRQTTQLLNFVGFLRKL